MVCLEVVAAVFVETKHGWNQPVVHFTGEPNARAMHLSVVVFSCSIVEGSLFFALRRQQSETWRLGIYTKGTCSVCSFSTENIRVSVPSQTVASAIG